MKSVQVSSENRESKSSPSIRSLACSFRNGIRRLYLGRHVLSNEKSIAVICFHEVAVAEVAIFRITYVRTHVGTDVRTCIADLAGAFVVSCVDLYSTCEGHFASALLASALHWALVTSTFDGRLRWALLTGTRDGHSGRALATGTRDGQLRRALVTGT